MLIEASASVYGDELITATELNQQPGRVLDKAWERPVTITRNEQHFALLRRDRMTDMVKAAKMSQIVIELIDVAYRSRLGEQISSEHPLGWVKAFDNDELRELIAEVENAYRLVDSDSQAWDNLEALIHEWRESAIAINSKELAAAFNDQIDDDPFDEDREIIEKKIAEAMAKMTPEMWKELAEEESLDTMRRISENPISTPPKNQKKKE